MTVVAPPAAVDRDVWYSRCPVPTPFAVALKQGWLHDALAGQDGGASVPWRSLGESRDDAIRNAHFTHAKADVFRHGGNIPPLWARSEGAETRLLGVSWVTMRQQVQVLPDSGIRSPADLAGRRILIQRSPAASIDYWRASTLRTYEAALASAGLGLADVQFVEQISQVGSQPGAQAKLSPDGSLWTADRSLAPDRLDRVNNDTPDVLTVSANLIEHRPEIVERVILQLLRARDWARAHRVEVVRLMAQEFKTSEALVDQSWGDDLADGLDIDLGEESLAALQSQNDFLLRHDFISRPVDLKAWIDPRPLEAAHARYAAARPDSDTRA